MSKNSGYIVTYTDNQGQEKRGHVYHRMQTRPVQEAGKVAINEVDQDGNHAVRAGREVVVLKDKDKVKTIGFLN